MIYYVVQDISDDSNGPHVSGEGNGFEIDDLRSHKFRCTKQNLEFFVGFMDSRKAKIDDFDAVATFGQAKNVFWFEVEMEYVFGVHERDTVQDLLHETDTGFFCEHKFVFDHTVK